MALAPIRKITIEFIPPREQRYPTCGDWQDETNGGVSGELHLRISQTARMRDAAFCVAVHELLEAWLYQRAGGTGKMVDQDDARKLKKPYTEHGDMPSSRYHRQHDFAWCVERLLAHELGLDWTRYEDELDRVYDEVPKRRKEKP